MYVGERGVVKLARPDAGMVYRSWKDELEMMWSAGGEAVDWYRNGCQGT